MYIANSVKNALKTNSNLEFDDDFGCPRVKPRNSNSNVVCCKDIQKCSYAPKRMCKQCVTVTNLHPPSMYILAFRFTIAPNRPDGFIDENDTALATMIKRGLIDPKLLKIA